MHPSDELKVYKLEKKTVQQGSTRKSLHTLLMLLIEVVVFTKLCVILPKITHKVHICR